MDAELVGAANRAMAIAVKELLDRAGPARDIRSVATLAERTGIAYGTLRKRLDAKQPFDYGQLTVIAGALGASAMDLMRMAEAVRQALQVGTESAADAEADPPPPRVVNEMAESEAPPTGGYSLDVGKDPLTPAREDELFRPLAGELPDGRTMNPSSG